MRSLRPDMNRDECRKCLRYLELDAYGSMVSVLRAQGPFTEEKQKLLQELAKVLHISNERHRAEVRRAVNDEKLTVIAEQLSGPNTGTDWAIEGRRTIPLLPRLQAHTAFTALANSLSLATMTANTKKPRPKTRSQDLRVKTETESPVDVELDEKLAVQTSRDLESDVNRKKRKRSVQEQITIECDKSSQTQNGKNSHKTIIYSTIYKEQTVSPPSLPVSTSNKVLILSPTTQVTTLTTATTAIEATIATAATTTTTTTATSPIDTTNHSPDEKLIANNNNINNNTSVQISRNPSINNDQLETITATITTTITTATTTTVPIAISYNSSGPVSCKQSPSIVSTASTQPHIPSSLGNQHISTIVPTCIATKNRLKIMPLQTKDPPKTVTLSIPSGSLQRSIGKDLEDCSISESGIKTVTLSNNNSVKNSVTDATNANASCVARITSISGPLIPVSAIITTSGQRVTCVTSASAASGPGPPCMTTTNTTVTCKKLQTGILNHQPATKMGITLNSNQTLSVASHPNARLATKANVIVIQKGPARGVTLSHAGKEVLGKVIMGGKNLCLTNQQNTSSIALLPHRVTPSNGNQNVTVLSSVNSNSMENPKTGNMIVFNLRDEIVEKNNCISQLLNNSNVFENSGNHLLSKEESDGDKDLCSIKNDDCQLKIDDSSFKAEEIHRKIKDVCINMNSKEADSPSSIEFIESKEILKNENHIDDIQDSLDSQKEMYNFESTDETANIVQGEESISNSGIDIFTKALASADINLENFQYIGNDLVETGNSMLTVNQLNKLNDS